MNTENNLREEYKGHWAGALQDPKSKYYSAYVDGKILQAFAEHEGKRFLGASMFPSSDNAIAVAKGRIDRLLALAESCKIAFEEAIELERTFIDPSIAQAYLDADRWSERTTAWEICWLNANEPPQSK